MINRKNLIIKLYILTLFFMILFFITTGIYIRARTIIHTGIETNAMIFSVKNSTNGEALYTDGYGDVHIIQGYLGQDIEQNTMIKIYYLQDKPGIYIVPNAGLFRNVIISATVMGFLICCSIILTFFSRKKDCIKLKEQNNKSEKESHKSS